MQLTSSACRAETEGAARVVGATAGRDKGVREAAGPGAEEVEGAGVWTGAEAEGRGGVFTCPAPLPNEASREARSLPPLPLPARGGWGG